MLLVHLGQDRNPRGERQDKRGEALFYSRPVRPPAPLAACDRTLVRNGAEIKPVVASRLGGLAHALFGNGFACQRSAVFSFHFSPRRLISVSYRSLFILSMLMPSIRISW